MNLSLDIELCTQGFPTWTHKIFSHRPICARVCTCMVVDYIYIYAWLYIKKELVILYVRDGSWNKEFKALIHTVKCIGLSCIP